VELGGLMILASLFCHVLTAADHLVLAVLAIVGFSLALYIICYCSNASRAAREAGIKYFYLSSLSVGFILFGALLLVLSFKTTSLYDAGLHLT